MAADGSLKFDTAINLKGFNDGISTLNKALGRLESAVDRLAKHIDRSFAGVGNASASAAKEAEHTVKSVDQIGDAAEKSAEKVKSLEDQMEDIKITRWEDTPAETAEQGLPATADWNGEHGYDKSAMEFLESYEKKAQAAEQHTNEFRQEIERLKAQIKQLESQGKYFGDEEYDDAFLKLQQLEQALKDYKRELVSPTPNANPFGIDTISGKVLELDMQLRRLAESGKGLGDAEYDAVYRKLAIAKEEAKAYAAELAKTPKMIEEENRKLAEQEAKRQAAAQKEAQRQAEQEARIDARITKEEQLLETQRAKEVQESLEQQRLEEIADAAEIACEEVINLREELAELNARQADLEKAGLGYGYAEYDANAQKIAEINAELRDYKRELEESGEKTSFFAGIVRNAFLAAGNQVRSFGSLVGKWLGAPVKNAVSHIKSIVKPTNKASKSILKLSNMFSLMMIRMAMRAAIQGFKEGMENLVQYSDEANQSMSELMSSSTYLKNSFAAAFAPILSYAVPTLSTLANYLAMVIGYVNQFYAALGGGTTYTKAVKTTEDYAASLKKTGSAAKDAGKDAKKALAPFDDLVQIQQEGTNSSGGGGAGSADPSLMFTEETVDSNISGFAEKIKELFEAEDWSGIGQLIGEKVNESIDSIDYSGIGSRIGYGINSSVQTAYHFLDTVNFTNIGKHVGELLNHSLEEIDFHYAGAIMVKGFTILPDILIGAISEINWGLVAKSFSDFLIGAFDEGTKWLSQYDWSQLGAGLWTNIKEVVANIDWGGIASSMFTFLGTAIRSAGQFLGGFFGDIGADIKTWWDSEIQGQNWLETAANLLRAIGEGFADIGTWVWNNIVDPFCAALLGENTWADVKEVGKNIIDGLYQGILDFFADPIEWIKTNIVDPFVDGIKNLLGIHSPSTVMAEMGPYLWEGFCNGVTEFFSNPGDFIRKNITDPFINGVKNFLGIHSHSTVMEGIGTNAVAGFNQGVINEQSASQNVIQSWATGVAKWFSNKFGISNSDATESKKWATSIMSGFNTTINSQYTNSQSVMERWAENVRQWFIGNTDAQGVNEMSWEKFAENIIQAFINAINIGHTGTKEPTENWASHVREWFWGDADQNGTGGMYAAFYQMAKRINEGFANGISDFAYMAKSAIREWAEDIMDAAEEEFDIHSPSREFREIAEYVVKGFNEGLSDMISTSKNVAERWLDSVMDIFDAADISVPVGLDIPNASSYIPRIATGTVVPPRAGEASLSMRSSGESQAEVLSYLIQKLDELLAQLKENGNQPIELTLKLTGNLAALARTLKPELDKEAVRKGVSLVIVGGA